MPVRLGVVGCGVIGPSHMHSAVQCPDTELVAVADRIPERRDEAAVRFCVPTTYAEGADLVRDPAVDAVVLAFPAAERADLALAAFALGKHVLLEKPVAMDARQVEAMIAARGPLTAACCSSRYRFTEAARVATEFVATGALGRLRVVRVRAWSGAGPIPETLPPPWRLRSDLNGGGILMNWGCYDLDYIMGVAGWAVTPRTVFARTWPAIPAVLPGIAPNSDAETHGIALVRCDGDAVISFERGEYMPSEGEGAWQLIGTDGSLRLLMTAHAPARIVHERVTPDAGVVSEVIWEQEQDMGPVHSGPTADFARAILTGSAPKTSLEQALIVQRITDAIYASSASGQCVSV
jgi:predicted dehydrogenase